MKKTIITAMLAIGMIACTPGSVSDAYCTSESMKLQNEMRELKNMHDKGFISTVQYIRKLEVIRSKSESLLKKCSK